MTQNMFAIFGDDAVKTLLYWSVDGPLFCMAIAMGHSPKENVNMDFLSVIGYTKFRVNFHGATCLYFR